MKTNKHQTLLLVKKQQAVHARDLVQHFAYSPGDSAVVSFAPWEARAAQTDRTKLRAN